MVRSMKFASTGLRRFYERDDARRLNAEHIERIRLILTLLSKAKMPQQLDQAFLRLHPLKGKFRGFWSVRVSKNWRIIFRFAGSEAVDIDLLDYHD